MYKNPAGFVRWGFGFGMGSGYVLWRVISD